MTCSHPLPVTSRTPGKRETDWSQAPSRTPLQTLHNATFLRVKPTLLPIFDSLDQSVAAQLGAEARKSGTMEFGTGAGAEPEHGQFLLLHCSNSFFIILVFFHFIRADE